MLVTQWEENWIFSLKVTSFSDWKAYQFRWTFTSVSERFYEATSFIDRNHYKNVCFSIPLKNSHFYLDRHYRRVWDGCGSWLIRLLCDSQEFHFWPRFSTNSNQFPAHRAHLHSMPTLTDYTRKWIAFDHYRLLVFVYFTTVSAKALMLG